MDPFTAFLVHDWGALGGWSLFVSLAIIVVLAFFREQLVPGARVRRLEALLEKSVDTIQQQSRQIDRLTVTSELVGNLLSEATPHKGVLRAGEDS